MQESIPFHAPTTPKPEEEIAPKQAELFRIAATIGVDYRQDAVEIAVSEILDWGHGDIEQQLPKGAKKLESFKFYDKKASLVAHRIDEPACMTWAIRIGRTDDSFATLLRSTEAVIVRHDDKSTTLTVRQVVDLDHRMDSAPPEAPAFVAAIDAVLGLHIRGEELGSIPWVIRTEDECRRFFEKLTDSSRPLPIFVLSVPESARDPQVPLLKPEPIAIATAGLAQVVVLPPNFTYSLTDRFGKELSVYLGAIRAYYPGFNEGTNPSQHDLILPKNLMTVRDQETVSTNLRSLAAKYSLTRLQLGRDIIEFDEIRAKAIPLERESITRQPDAEEPPVEETKFPEPDAQSRETDFLTGATSEPAAEPLPSSAAQTTREIVFESHLASPPSSTAQFLFKNSPDAEGNLAHGINDADVEPPPAASTQSTAEEESSDGEVPDAPELSDGIVSRAIAKLWSRISGNPDPHHLGKQLVAFAKRNEELVQRNRELAHRNEQLADQNGDLVDRNEDLRVKLAEEVEYRAVLSEEHDTNEQRANQAGAESEQLRIENEGLQLEVAEIRVEVKQLRDENEELQLNLTECQAELDKLPPRDWAKFSGWCKRTLSGKVTLTGRAEGGIKRAKFKDVELAAKGLEWLGTEYRDKRLSGGDPGLKGPIPCGLHNLPCGENNVRIKWAGQWKTADWHLKNQTKTFHQERCLRIYYFWDEINKQVVIASMPEHC